MNGSDGTLKLTVNFDIATETNTDQILSQMRTNQANSQLPSSVTQYGVTVQKSTATPLMLVALYQANVGSAFAFAISCSVWACNSLRSTKPCCSVSSWKPPALPRPRIGGARKTVTTAP